MPTLVLIPVLILPLVPAPVPVPVAVSSLLALVPCSPLGTTLSGRRRVLHPELLATFRRHLLSTETMPRAEGQFLVFYSSSFSDVTRTRAPHLPPFAFHYRPLFRPRPRPRLRYCPCSFPAPVPLPVLRSLARLHSRSRSRSVSVPITVHVPALDPVRSVPWTRLPSRYSAHVQKPGLANGAFGCPQAPLPVCRDHDACGMKVSPVK